MAQIPRKATQEWSADELIPFGKYLLLERISSGATAAVFRAKTVSGDFEQVVALKRVLPHMAGDRAFMDAFVQEARLAARLSHPNICPIYELGRVGQSLYMTMENLEGKDLGYIVKAMRAGDRQMPPEAAAWITARLCDALDYAHRLVDANGEPIGIVHRDLSPANVVIGYDGHVKLIDFGIARAVGRAQQTNLDALKQKLGYMSPEMVKGQRVDARSDVFGVGVLLYELVTGRRLFDGSDDLATLGLVSRASVPPPSAVTEEAPEALELIIMKALAREPDARYPTAGDMAEALMGFITQESPMYGPRNLERLVSDLLGQERDAEQARVRRLAEAARDPSVLASRRAFFASASGAAAAARAQVQDPDAEAHQRLESGEGLREDAFGMAEPDTSTETISLAELDPSAEAALSGASQAPRPTVGLQVSAEARRKAALAEADVTTPYVRKFQQSHPTSRPAPGGSVPPARTPASPGPTPSIAPAPGPQNPASRAPTRTPFAPSVLNAPPPPAVGWPGAPQPRHRSAAPPPAAAGSTSAPPATTWPPPPAPARDSAPLPQPANMRAAPPANMPAPQPPSAPAATAPLDSHEAEQTADASNRLSAWMLAIGLSLLLGTLGWFLHRHFAKTDAQATEQARYGTLEVRTVPPVAATVLLDGSEQGQAPLRLTGVTAGSHELKVAAPGFQPATRDVEVPADGAAQITIEIAHSDE